MQENKAGNILIIRFSALGDIAMVIPVLLALLSRYPALKLRVLTRVRYEPLFQLLPGLSVFGADLEGSHRGLGGLWKLYRELRRDPPDAVADLHGVLRTRILKYFFALDGIPIRTIDKGRKEKKELTARKNKKFRPLRSTHLRYADVFAELGYPLSLEPGLRLARQPLSAKTKPYLETTGGKKIGIAPFAAHRGKMYPEKLMMQLLASLAEEGSYTLLLFGGGELEAQRAAELAKGVRGCVSVAGKFSFSEELSLISQLDLMLAMDSANGHLAAVFGVPTLTVWGVTHPYAGFAPFGQRPEQSVLADREQFPLIPTSVYGNSWPKGYEAAMESISPGQIAEKIREMLSQQDS